MFVNSNTNDPSLSDQLNAQQAQRGFESGKYMDLSVSNMDIMNDAWGVMQNGSPADQFMVQQALQERSRLISMLTQLLKMFHDLVMSVVRNFRLN